MPRPTLFVSCFAVGILCFVPGHGLAQSVDPEAEGTSAPTKPEDPRIESLTKQIADLQREVDRLARELQSATSEARTAELEATNGELERALASEKAKNTELLKEVEALRSESASKAKLASKEKIEPKPIDIIAGNTKWEGTRYPNSGPRSLPWEMHVKNRSGNTFSGTVWIGRKKTPEETYEFTGSVVDHDTIEIKTKKKSRDPFLQTYAGTIVGTEISFTFSGITNKGNEVGGTANLKPAER